MLKKLLLFFVLLTTMVGRMSGATTTWDFTSVSLSSNTDSWTATSTAMDTWKRDFSGFSTTTVSGLSNLQFNGTWRIVNNTHLWMFAGAAIQIPVTNGQIVTVVGTSNTDGGISVANGSISTISPSNYAYDKSFTATADGYVTLTNNNSGSRYFYLTSITVEDAPEIYFEPGTYTANIQDYNLFTEPTLHYPEGATVVYSSNDQKKANILENKDVVFRGTGVATINATVTYKGIEYLAQYNVTVSDPGAWPVINGNTCTLSGVGRLNPQSANVPGLSMEFGNIYMGDPYKNTTIVQSINNNLYASTIDQNGYRHIWWGNDGIPYQGSFYIFKPTVNGTLKVWVSNNTSSKTAYLIDSSAPSTKISETNLGIATSNSPTQVTATLTADKTYYLCTSGETLLFNKFTYEPSFKFSANSATVVNGTTSYNGITLEGVSGDVKYTTECYGNIASATLGNSGHITNITYYNDTDQGGAVVVHAFCEAGTVTYVLTVAYKQHLWDFTDTYNPSSPHANHGNVLSFDNYPSILADLRDNNTDWAVTYKVRRYEGNSLIDLNGPVYANATAIDGTNADYNSRTAGLVINAGSKAFGSNAIIPDSYYNEGKTPGADANKWEGEFKSECYSELLGIETSVVSGASGITLFQGTKLTIPKLKIGQYVRVKWRRHTDGQGDKVLLTNLSDLMFTPMEYVLVNNIRMRRAGRGYHVFRVSTDGDVSFQLNDVGGKGWVNIYSIEVSDDFLDDNCWNDKVGIKAGTMDTEFNFPNPNELVYESGTEHSWTTSGNNLYGQQNLSMYYKLEGLESKNGDLSPTLQGTIVENSVTKNSGNQPVFTSIFKPIGHGQLVAVSEGFTYRVADDVFDIGDFEENEHIYWLDLERTLITVNEKGSTIQKYPYTWDFTRLASRTILRLNEDTQYWSGDATNGFVPTAAYQKAFTENTEITTMGDPWERDRNITTGEDYYGLAEYDGIGFNTNPENGYSTSLTSIKVTADGTGLVIGDGSADAKAVTLNIPKVDAGYTVYVRVKENDNASVTVGGTSNVGYTDSQTGEKVYTFTTTEETDVPVAVKNAEVKKIAVTKMTKTCWLKDSNSKDGDTYEYYNTDSHDKAIDYSLTEYFTGNDIKAYTVTATYKDSKTQLVNSVSITPIVKAPAAHGYVVSTKYDSDPNQANVSSASIYKRPLFTPSVLDQEITTNEGRMEDANDDFLKPHVTSGSVVYNENKDNSYDYYVLTNRYYYIYGNDHSEKKAEVPGFYRLENVSETLASNRAYLVLPKQSSGNVKFFPLFDFDGELVDAIDEIPAIATNGIDVNGTFYTLQGLKIEGFPKKGGIYIQNGKKVMVK